VCLAPKARYSIVAWGKTPKFFEPKGATAPKARFIAAIHRSGYSVNCVALSALGYRGHPSLGRLPQAQHERAPSALNRYRLQNLRCLCDAVAGLEVSDTADLETCAT